MLEASLEQLLEWGPQQSQDYCREICERFIPQWEALGCQVESDSWRAGHLFALRLPGAVDYENLLQRLVEHRCYVSLRGSGLRVSPNVYNDAADLAVLTAVLAEQ